MSKVDNGLVHRNKACFPLLMTWIVLLHLKYHYWYNCNWNNTHYNKHPLCSLQFYFSGLFCETGDAIHYRHYYSMNFSQKLHSFNQKRFSGVRNEECQMVILLGLCLSKSCYFNPVLTRILAITSCALQKISQILHVALIVMVAIISLQDMSYVQTLLAKQKFIRCKL